MKKIISLIVVVMVLTSILAACGEDKPVNPTTGTTPTSETLTDNTSPSEYNTEPSNGTEPSSGATEPSEAPTEPSEGTESSEGTKPSTEPTQGETEPPVTNPPETEPTVTNPPETEPAPTTPPATEPQPTQPIITEPKPTDPPVTEPPETTPPTTEPPSQEDKIPCMFEEATIKLYDKNGVTITATSFVMLGEGSTPGSGLLIDLEMENKTSKTLQLDLSHVILDGYTVPVLCDLTAEPGQTGDGFFLIPDYHLGKVSDQPICLITWKNAHLVEVVEDGTNMIDRINCTFGMEPGSNPDPEIESGDMLTSDKLIVEAKSVYRRGEYCYFIILIDNRTGQDIRVQMSNVGLNDGFKVEPTSQNFIYRDTAKYCEMELYAGPDMDYSNGVYFMSCNLVITDVAGDVLFTTDTITVSRD